MPERDRALRKQPTHSASSCAAALALFLDIRYAACHRRSLAACLGITSEGAWSTCCPCRRGLLLHVPAGRAAAVQPGRLLQRRRGVGGSPPQQQQQPAAVAPRAAAARLWRGPPRRSAPLEAFPRARPSLMPAAEPYFLTTARERQALRRRASSLTRLAAPQVMTMTRFPLSLPCLCPSSHH